MLQPALLAVIRSRRQEKYPNGLHQRTRKHSSAPWPVRRCQRGPPHARTRPASARIEAEQVLHGEEFMQWFAPLPFAFRAIRAQPPAPGVYPESAAPLGCSRVPLRGWVAHAAVPRPAGPCHSTSAQLRSCLLPAIPPLLGNLWKTSSRQAGRNHQMLKSSTTLLFDSQLLPRGVSSSERNVGV